MHFNLSERDSFLAMPRSLTHDIDIAPQTYILGLVIKYTTPPYMMQFLLLCIYNIIILRIYNPKQVHKIINENLTIPLETSYVVCLQKT